jgi:DNA-binding CsgD family transcriptional regulator
VQTQRVGAAVYNKLFLDEIVRNAVQRPTLVVIDGAPGIGKSTLLRRFLESARQEKFQVHAVAADRWQHESPFTLLRAAIPSRVSVGIDSTENAAAPFSMVSENRARMATELLDDLEQLLEVGSTALLLDDVHLANATDLDLCSQFLRHVNSSLLVVVAGRSVAPRLISHADHYLTVEPFTETESMAFASGLLGAEPGPRLRRCIRSANGVPLAIVELVKSAINDGLLATSVISVEDTARESIDLITDDLPTSLTARTARRLQRLGPAAEELGAAIAVCGTIVEPGMATAIARTDETFAGDSLRKLVDAGFVEVRGDHLVWSHELVRETVLLSLSEVVRADLELRAGRFLTDRNGANDVAVAHLERGAAPFDELASVYRRLAKVGTSTQRVNSLRWLLEFDTQFRAGSDERFMWLRELCRSAVEVGDNAVLNWASHQLTIEYPSESMAWLYYVSSLIGSNRMVEAREAGLAGIEIVNDRATKAKLMAAITLSAMTSLDSMEREELDRVATEVLHENDDAAIVAVHTVRSRLYAHAFAHDLARKDSDIAVGAPSSPDPEVMHYQPHHFQAMARFESDDIDGALASISEGRAVAEKLGLVWPDGVLLSAAAPILWAAGRSTEAFAAATDAVRSLRASSITPTMLPSLAVLAEVALDDGNLVRAEELLDEADHVVAEGGKFGLEIVANARARLLDASGQTGAALGVVELFWGIFNEVGIGPAMMYLTVPVVSRAHAAGRFELLESVAQRMDDVPLHASDSVRSLVQWVRAIHMNNAKDAELAVDRYPKDRARQRLELIDATTAIFRTPKSAVMTFAGRNGALQKHSAENETPKNFELTAMQRLVAEALSQGCSNREIAERHYMKVRTVETHVQRILRKLGVHSRTQAISLLLLSSKVDTSSSHSF